jgi:PAS domain S-box-containing protein
LKFNNLFLDGGIEISSNNNFREEIFDKSPIGILFYDKQGKLIEANQSALKIAGIRPSTNFEDINLFDNLDVALKKDELLKDGLIKFQALLDFKGNNIGFKNSKKSGKVFIDWIISRIDSGFLVQIQDITVSKIAEDSLRESEEKYHRLFDDDLTGDFIANCDGEILECNPAFVEIYGFKDREKAVGSNIFKLNRNDWMDLVARLENEPRIKGYHTWHTRPDGMRIHVIANVVGIFNDSNELIQIKGYVFDDTDRKIAEDSLRESEEKYHRLFDDDLTGDFIANCDGEIVECNSAFAEIYGFGSCKMASKWNFSQFNPFDWPHMVTRLRSESKIKGYQSWQRRSDGMRIHVIANVVGIFNDSNELIQIKGYVFDDTDRKKAEEELINSKRQMKEILDSIQDCFVALNQYWDFIYVNQFAAEYFGVEADDIVGRNVWKIFPELRNTSYENAVRNAMKEQEIQHFKAQDIRNPDQWYDFSVYPWNEGISIYWRDITRSKNRNK